MNIPTLGHVYGYIEAYRIWRVNHHDLRLYSFFAPFEWKPDRPFTATYDSSTPEQGIHAYKQLRDIFREWPESSWVPKSQQIPFQYVSGKVALWGTLTEHERGYRATCAYPLELYLHQDIGIHKAQPVNEMLAKLAKAYGIDAQYPTTALVHDSPL